MRDAKRVGSKHIFAKIILVVLLLVLAYAGMLVFSASQLRDHANVLTQRTETLKTSLNDGRLKDAYDDMTVVAEEISWIDGELHKAHWLLARNIPFLSDDVIVAQEMTEIGSDLANRAVKPVLTDLEKTLGGIPATADDINWMALPASARDGLPALLASLKHAQDIAKSCQQRANALKPSHFDAINTMETKVREVCDGVVEAFSSYSQVLDVAGVAGDLINIFGS